MTLCGLNPGSSPQSTNRVRIIRPAPTSNTADEDAHPACWQQLAGNAGTARPERYADGEFACPARSSGQQQVGDIYAGNQQNEHHGAENHEEHGTHIAHDFVLERKQISLLISVNIRIFSGQVPGDAIHVSASLFECNTRFKAADCIQSPARGTIVVKLGLIPFSNRDVYVIERPASLEVLDVQMKARRNDAS